MKFKFTTTPLKDTPLGAVVDGYTLTSRSHTGKNAIGWRKLDNGKFEEVTLIYTTEPPVAGVTASTEVMERLVQQPAAPYLEERNDTERQS